MARASSRVQAVACFFPPTDFLNYGTPGYAWLNSGPKDAFKAPFDFQRVECRPEKVRNRRRRPANSRSAARSRPSITSARTIRRRSIIHGDKDGLVPLQQSELIIAKLKEAGVPCELVDQARRRPRLGQSEG